MIVCVDCRIEMFCQKTGVGVDYGGGHVYPGDAFYCADCGAHIVHTNELSYQDPKYMREFYVPMKYSQEGIEGAPEDKWYPPEGFNDDDSDPCGESESQAQRY